MPSLIKCAKCKKNPKTKSNAERGAFGADVSSSVLTAPNYRPAAKVAAAAAADGDAAEPTPPAASEAKAAAPAAAEPAPGTSLSASLPSPGL
jgi:hypothetical protein